MEHRNLHPDFIQSCCMERALFARKFAPMVEDFGGWVVVEALEFQWGIFGGGWWRHWRFSTDFLGVGGGGIGDLVGNFSGWEVEASEIQWEIGRAHV